MKDIICGCRTGAGARPVSAVKIHIKIAPEMARCGKELSPVLTLERNVSIIYMKKALPVNGQPKRVISK